MGSVGDGEGGGGRCAGEGERRGHTAPANVQMR